MPSLKDFQINSRYLTDPCKELSFFEEILQEDSLTVKQKQQMIMDLSCIDLNEKGKNKSQRGRLLAKYISFARRIYDRVREAQLEHAHVGVANAKRFFAKMKPIQVVETIVSVLDQASSTHLVSKDLLPLRTKVVRELGEQAVLSAGCKEKKAWCSDGKQVTVKMEGEIGLLLYDLCEEWELVKSFSNEELGIAPVKSGKAGGRYFTEVESFPAPPQHIANHLPRIVPPSDWVKNSQHPHIQGYYKKGATLSNEWMIPKHKNFSKNVDGGAPHRFPSPIKLQGDDLCITKDQAHFCLFLSEEHVSLLNRLHKVAMRVCNPLLDYITERREELEEIGLLQSTTLANQNIVAEVKEFKRQLKERLTEFSKRLTKLKLSDEKAEERKEKFENKLKRAIYRVRLEYNQACGQLFQERMTIGTAMIMRDRPLYLTASQDFRGRVYRWSILSPQRSTLARALMFFDHESPVNCSNAPLFASHIGFAFKKFETFAESAQWVADNIPQIIALHRRLFYIEDGKRVDLASVEDPWRALSISLLLNEKLVSSLDSTTEELSMAGKVAEKPLKSFALRSNGKALILTYHLRSSDLRVSVITIGGINFHPFSTGLPFHLDATANAFQILGLLTRDFSICRDCNIIPPPPGEKMYKRDLYMEAAKSMASSNPSLEFPRSAVKQILMPKSYGLTNHGMFDRIREAYPQATRKELKMRMEIYKNCWSEHFKSIETIFKLFSETGKMAAFFNLPLVAGIHPRVTMWQQYRSHATIKSRIPLKRRGKNTLGQTRDRTVNIRIYDPKRGDITKSGNSTAANITHLLDGLICTEVVRLFFLLGEAKLQGRGKSEQPPPLYTNHDCFYTTLKHAEEICPIYNRAVVNVLSAPEAGGFIPSVTSLPGEKPAGLIERILFVNLYYAVTNFNGPGTLCPGGVGWVLGNEGINKLVLDLGGLGNECMYGKKLALDFVKKISYANKQDLLSSLKHAEQMLGPAVFQTAFHKRVLATIHAYLDYKEMVAERKDLLPQVLESKFSVFP